MRKILIATFSGHMGGAEKLILQLGQVTPSVSHEMSLGLLNTKYRGGLGSLWQGPVVGIREILWGRYDVIHSHLFLPGLLIRVRRLWDSDFKWIHTVHYADYRGLRFARVKNFLDRNFIFPESDALVAVSDAVFKKISNFR